MTSWYRQFYIYLIKKWHFDQIGNELIVHKLMNFGYRISFQSLDKGNIETFGAFGSSVKVTQLSKGLSFLHSGFIFHYSFVMIVGMIALLTYFLIMFVNINLNMFFIALIFSYSLFIVE
jgi:NADH-quinone oxidoreductase subunit L